MVPPKAEPPKTDEDEDTDPPNIDAEVVTADPPNTEEDAKGVAGVVAEVVVVAVAVPKTDFDPNGDAEAVVVDGVTEAPNGVVVVEEADPKTELEDVAKGVAGVVVDVVVVAAAVPKTEEVGF